MASDPTLRDRRRQQSATGTPCQDCESFCSMMPRYSLDSEPNSLQLDRKTSLASRQPSGCTCPAASSAKPRKRSCRRPRSIYSTLALAVLAAAPVAAVQVPFTNCLSDSYRNNDPTLLQWVPLYADAKFDTESSSHNLEVVVWGNVTGSRENVRLPPPGSPYWDDNNETPGKIIQNPEPNSRDPRATTLFRRVNVATFEPWRQAVDFCRSGLVNGECPLGPVFPTDNL
jgi:hypothetical protein